MNKILDLQNGDNFSLQYTTSIPSTVVTVQGREYYVRLTEIIPPVVFDTPIILINVSTTVPPGKIWDFAGNISQIVPTALGDSIVEKSPVYLRKRNLIIFSQVSNDYKITYLPPRWFTDVSLTIYQYDGTYTEQVDVSLARIESKIDALS
jgi:hypothetical protein